MQILNENKLYCHPLQQKKTSVACDSCAEPNTIDEHGVNEPNYMQLTDP